MAKKKKGGSAKGGRPAVLSLGKPAVKGKKVRKVTTRGKTMTTFRRAQSGGKNKKRAYKQRGAKGY